MRKQGGVNKFEFSLALAVIGIVVVLMFRVLVEAQEFGEKNAVEATIRNVDSGLRWAMAERIAQGREGSFSELVGSNPIGWLVKPPEGYLGELSRVPELPPGGWYFDTRSRELVYRPRQARHLERENGAELLRWRVEMSGKWSSGAVAGVRMLCLTPYRWF